MRTIQRPYSPPPYPGVELFRFQGLPLADTTLPEDRNIPTQTIRLEQKIGSTTVRGTLEIPEEILDPVPLGIVPGWHGIEPAYEPLRQWCARNGRASFTMGHTHELRQFAGLHPSHLFHPEKLLCQTLHGAIRAVRQSQAARTGKIDATSIDLANHSMGGRTTTNCILHADETRKPLGIRSAIFMAPAGCEDHTVVDFLTDRFLKFPNEIKQAYSHGKLRPYLNYRNGAELLQYMLGGGTRAFKEGVSIGQANIRPAIRKVGELGIHTALLEFEADSLIDPHASLRQTGPLVDIAALFPYRWVGHLGPQTHAEATGQALFELFDSLNHTSLSVHHGSAKAA